MDVLVILSIFISILFTFINVAKLIRGQRIPFWAIAIMSVGITSVVTHFIGMW